MRAPRAVVLAAIVATGCSGSGNGSSSSSGVTSAASSGSTGSHGASGSSSSSSGSTHASTSSGSNSSGTAVSNSSGTAASTSGSVSSSSSGSSGLGYGDFCAQLNQEYCAGLQTCGYLDPAFSCAGVNVGLLPPCDGGEPPGFQFEPTTAAACLAAASNTSDCSTYSSSPTQADGGQPCSAVLSPNLPVGAACEGSPLIGNACQQPADGGYVACLTPSGACGGTCATKAAIGQSCDEGVGCATGAFCNYSTGLCAAYLSTGSQCIEDQGCNPATDSCGFPTDGGFLTEYCVANLAPGAACNGLGCGPGYYCGSTDGGFSGLTCLVQLGQGDTCSPYANQPCLSSLSCFGGTCVPALAATGAGCGANGGYVSCAQGYGLCVITDGGAIGSCVAPGASGDACDAAQNGTCEPYLACVDGHCTGPIANGNPCTQESNCATGYCNDPDGGTGTCDAYGTSGQACSFIELCAASLVCVNGHCGPVATNGQPCDPPGSSDAFSSTGCAYGDYCNGTDCVVIAHPGATCTRADVPSCLSSYCDSTGHCASFLPAGSPCAPTAFECSDSYYSTTRDDGGLLNTDLQCVALLDGGAACAPTCP